MTIIPNRSIGLWTPRLVHIGAVAIGALGASVIGWASSSRRPPASPAAYDVGAPPAPDVSSPGLSRRLIGRYQATVVRVIDGDTVEARVVVWLGQDNLTRVRLRGVDAPEISGACNSERDLAIAARDRLLALIGGRAVTLAQVGGDKYFGRIVADLLVDGVSAGDVLLREGLARPYGGGRRESWCAVASR